MRSLLPFLTAKEQRRSTPSQFRINANFRTFQADTAPVYDSNTYSVGALLNQGSSSGWSWAVNYNYSNNQNVKPIGNDFAYSSHAVNFRLSRNIAPNLDANVSYGFIYSAYAHPDSVTKFTEYRVNKLHSLSAGINYAVNDTMRLYGNLAYQHNNSNLPTGFILSSEDASTLVGIQSPSLGDYHKYSISAGIGLNF
jgi:predicted porin